MLDAQELLCMKVGGSAVILPSSRATLVWCRHSLDSNLGGGMGHIWNKRPGLLDLDCLPKHILASLHRISLPH